jgi:hypothetical protein
MTRDLQERIGAYLEPAGFGVPPQSSTAELAFENAWANSDIHCARRGADGHGRFPSAVGWRSATVTRVRVKPTIEI